MMLGRHYYDEDGGARGWDATERLEQDAANLFFQLVSSRYEHASLILTSNLPVSSWAGVFGDQVVAAAMIDRIVHHADVIATNGTQRSSLDSGRALPVRAAGHRVPSGDRGAAGRWVAAGNGAAEDDRC
jgi:IstB-like ATP binding protein